MPPEEKKKKKGFGYKSELCRHRHDILSSWNMMPSTVKCWHSGLGLSFIKGSWFHWTSLDEFSLDTSPVPILFQNYESREGFGGFLHLILFFFSFFFFLYMPENRKAIRITHSRHGSAVVAESVCVLPGIHYKNVTNDLSMFSQVNKAILNCLCVKETLCFRVSLCNLRKNCNWKVESCVAQTALH